MTTALREKLLAAIDSTTDHRVSARERIADALLPLFEAHAAEVREACTERAEQSCRYVLKYNEDASFPSERESDYFKGFASACRICEKSIREHIDRHVPTIRAQGEKP